MPSIREALNSALDAADGATTEAADTPAPEAVEAAPAPAAEAAPAPEAEAPAETKSPLERAREEATGRFTKAPKAKPPAPKPEVVQLESTKAAAPEAKPVEGQEAAPEAKAEAPLRAPQSWTPAEREAWGKVPKEAQAAILRQDAEVRKVMREAAPARKFHQDFNALTAPYAPLLAGAEPLSAIRGMLQTVSTLATGSQQQKAALLAGLIRGYGVQIEPLAAALDGQPQPGQSGSSQGAAPVDAQAIYQQVRQQLMQDFTQQAQRSRQVQADADVEAFAQGHEFLDDVAEEMAALLESAARRGIALTNEEAYARACRAHPEVSKVVAQREAAARATAELAATQRARNAATSVKTQPATPPNGASRQTVRSALEAAAERHAR